MTSQASPDLQQLTETVARLSDALATSERRHNAMARSIRWASLAFIVLVAAVIYAASDWVKVYAAQQSVHWDPFKKALEQQPPGLNNVLMSLMGAEGMEGAMVKVLQASSMVAAQETMSFQQCVKGREEGTPEEQAKTLCYAKTTVEDLSEFFLDDAGNLPVPPGPDAPREEQMAYAESLMASTLMATGQTLVDASALVHRVRRDSDLLRRTVNDIGGLKRTLDGIKGELRLMNGALRGVPVMATEMNVMNQHMSVMSYGVGSTMGRMGNIMPW